MEKNLDLIVTVTQLLKLSCNDPERFLHELTEDNATADIRKDAALLISEMLNTKPIKDAQTASDAVDKLSKMNKDIFFMKLSAKLYAVN